METVYLGSAVVANGYQGDTATVHYCTDPKEWRFYAVWQTDDGLTGWHSLVTLADLPIRLRLRAVNERAIANGAPIITEVGDSQVRRFT